MAGIKSGDAPVTLEIIGDLGADTTNDAFTDDSGDAQLITSTRNKLRLGAAPGILFENASNVLNISAGSKMTFQQSSAGIAIIAPTFRHKSLDYGGGIRQSTAENIQTLSGATVNFPLNIPDGAVILGFSWKNTAAITSGDGGASWKATLAGGATDEVTSGESFALNAKGQKSVVGVGLTAATSINVTPDAGTFSGGSLLMQAVYRTIDLLT